MIRFRASALAVFAVFQLGFAAAQEVNEQNFTTVRDAIRKSPNDFKKVTAGCVANLRRNPGMIAMSEQMTSAPKGRGPEVYCDRLMKAWRGGRYTYKMHAAAERDSIDPEMTRILKGD